MPLYCGKLPVKRREIAVTYPSAFCPDSVLLLVFDQSQTKLTEHLFGTLPSFSGEMPGHSFPGPADLQGSCRISAASGDK